MNLWLVPSSFRYCIVKTILLTSRILSIQIAVRLCEGIASVKSIALPQRHTLDIIFHNGYYLRYEATIYTISWQHYRNIYTLSKFCDNSTNYLIYTVYVLRFRAEVEGIGVGYRAGNDDLHHISSHVISVLPLSHVRNVLIVWTFILNFVMLVQSTKTLKVFLTIWEANGIT